MSFLFSFKFAQLILRYQGDKPKSYLIIKLNSVNQNSIDKQL